VAAFRRAVADGADGVELDVLCCRSGDVVVFHDDDLRRLAERPTRIDGMSLDEIRKISFRGGGEIPTLAEALEACGDGILVNVELKATGHMDPRMDILVDGVSRAIDRAGAASRILVSSFSPWAVWRWQRRRADVKCALLFEAHAPLPLRKAWALPWLRPFAAHPEQGLCTESAVDHWHRAGFVVNTWTVDEPTRLRDLADFGVDGIITNNPAAARAALERREGMGAP
jgi:glycerophosphoryl diester phosphodiesterase